MGKDETGGVLTSLNLIRMERPSTNVSTVVTRTTTSSETKMVIWFVNNAVL